MAQDYSALPISHDPTTSVLYDTASGLVAGATDAGLTIATAESLTAGQLAATIADVPGASAVLRGGLIVYATDLKGSLAGVPETVLAKFGPVSPETAAALARGASDRCGADIGIGLTGVAGPDPQDGVDPGTVFLGLSRAMSVTVHKLEVNGDRARIRAAATLAGLDLARSAL